MTLSKFQEEAALLAAQNYIKKYQKLKPISPDGTKIQVGTAPQPPLEYSAPSSMWNSFDKPLYPTIIKMKVKDEVLIPSAPPPQLEPIQEEEFYVKKITQPNPFSNYGNLDLVSSQLKEMISLANAKDIPVPKMLIRAFHRILELEEKIDSKGSKDQWYKNGYYDGYHDGKHNLPNAFNDASPNPDSDDDELEVENMENF